MSDGETRVKGVTKVTKLEAPRSLSHLSPQLHKLHLEIREGWKDERDPKDDAFYCLVESEGEPKTLYIKVMKDLGKYEGLIPFIGQDMPELNQKIHRKTEQLNTEWLHLNNGKKEIFLFKSILKELYFLYLDGAERLGELP